MLIEAQRRKDDFQGGVAIRLADSQDWIFPRPTTYFQTDDDEVGIKQVWNMGEEFGRLFEAHLAAQAAQDGVALIRAELGMAEFLLLRNYDLTREEMRGLVRIGLGENADPDAATIHDALLGLVMGTNPAPKPSSDGLD